jgi:hypothetical protein
MWLGETLQVLSDNVSIARRPPDIQLPRNTAR